MQKLKIQLAVIITFIVSLTIASPAYAYLDPGTGSIILQGIIAGLAMISLTVKMWWYKLTNFFKTTKDPDQKDNDKTETDNLD